MSRQDHVTVMMHALGNFKDLEALLRNRTITTDEAAKLRAYAFERIGEKVVEIRKEIAKLQGVVQMLESIWREGSQVKPVAGGEVARLRQGVAQLHGWTISLAESDYNLLARTEGPTVASGKFHDLSIQLHKLQLERQAAREEIPGKGRISV